MDDALYVRAARLFRQMRNRHFFLIDLLLLTLIPFAALWLRVDDPRPYLTALIVLMAVTTPFWFAIFVWCGLYTRNWQYASIEELGTLIKAVLFGTLTSNVLLFFVLRPFNWVPDSFPRSIPLIIGLLVLLAVGGTRYSLRVLNRVRRQREFADHSHKRVAVIGAGDAGVLIAREMLANPQLGLNPVVFLDDDARKHYTMILGIPVAGGRDALDAVVRVHRVQEAIIAMPTAPGKSIREISADCLKHNLPVKTVPGMFELLGGTVTVSKLRDVEIDDLLRREPIESESAAIAEMLRGKRVLVTGAGGSIGGELCRQIARCAPAHVFLLGHGENSIFDQSNELRAAFPKVPFETVIADVRDAPRLRAVMARYRPELVFHAAAHKHVTLMEANVEDAISNNVVGTRVVLDAAAEHDVETFVMISTDKAVNPVSVMGATKRVAELYVHARALETGKRFVAVRFGNVLGSRGSVVPVFKQQIANGGPVQVTHPDVKRFFMTIPEAVQLVLQAATLGKGGEIFALDMGEPVKIVDLARDMIRLSGLQEGRDIDIEFTGLRPGEKLYEELFVPGEAYERTTREKILVARNGVRPSADEYARLYTAIADLIARAQRGDAIGARAKLAELTGLAPSEVAASGHAGIVS